MTSSHSDLELHGECLADYQGLLVDHQDLVAKHAALIAEVETLREAAQRVVQEWRTSSLHDPDPPALREAVEALVAALDRTDR